MAEAGDPSGRTVWQPSSVARGVRAAPGVVVMAFTARNLIVGWGGLSAGRVLVAGLLWATAVALVAMALLERAIADDEGLAIRNAFRWQRVPWRHIVRADPRTGLVGTSITLRTGRKLPVRAVRGDAAKQFATVVAARTAAGERTRPHRDAPAV